MKTVNMGTGTSDCDVRCSTSFSYVRGFTEKRIAQDNKSRPQTKELLRASVHEIGGARLKSINTLL